MNIMSKDLPGNLYICLTCGNWQTLNFHEAAFAQSGTMKPVCVSCDQIMYNVAANDGLELMEDPEPEPVEQLHPFDVRAILSDQMCAINPMLADVHNWIVYTLRKSLDEVIWFDVATPSSAASVFIPGPRTTFTVRFLGEDGEHKKTVNRTDYQQSVEQSS